MEALKQQAHSLRSLTYATDVLYGFYRGIYLSQHGRSVSFEQGGFEDFHLLEKVHLIGDGQNFANAVLNCRSPSNLRELVSEQPPILIPNRRPSATHGELMTRTILLNVSSPNIPPDLKQMTLIHDVNDVDEEEMDSMRSTAGRNILALEKAMREKFGLALSVKYKSRGKYYPPFLYGEPLPREELVYDGTAGGFTEAFETWPKV